MVAVDSWAPQALANELGSSQRFQVSQQAEEAGHGSRLSSWDATEVLLASTAAKAVALQASGAWRQKG